MRCRSKNQQIAGARATLKSAQAQVRLLQAEIVQTSLNAPFDGVVTQRLLDPGAFASPNQPILQISQIAHVYVNVNVPDSDLGYVQSDTPVSFTSSSLPGRTFSGRVFDVNATPTNGTLSYRARIVMPNPDDALRGGMLVSVSVRTRFQRNAIIVPLTAVVQGATGASVYTVAPLPAPPGGAPAGGPPAAKPGAPAGGPTFAQAKLVPVQARVADGYAGTGDEPGDNGGYDDHHDAARLAPGQEHGRVLARRTGRRGSERRPEPTGRFTIATRSDATDPIGA